MGALYHEKFRLQAEFLVEPFKSSNSLCYVGILRAHFGMPRHSPTDATPDSLEIGSCVLRNGSIFQYTSKQKVSARPYERLRLGQAARSGLPYGRARSHYSPWRLQEWGFVAPNQCC